MADVNVKRCDRCGRFCADEDTYVAVELRYADGTALSNDKVLDLCDGCEAGLHKYIGGSKLARPRKVAT
jgi:hypothetical protein